MTKRRTTAVIAVSVVLLVVLGVVGWWLLREDDGGDVPVEVPDPTPTATAAPPPAPEPARADPCDQWPRRSFVPDRITVRGVAQDVRVLGLPRDGSNVPGVPPTADRTAFAWDLGGVQPGSRTGHVLLNTHTWPDGSASGNRLLADLDVGGRMVLRGEGRAACYEVTERVEVPVEAGYPGWDAVDGRPEVVIVVCSGVRRGPGDWSHRTLWFASAVRPAA